MSEAVLITGGAGFIGSHLAERLVEKGRQVVCLDNFDDYYPAELKRGNLQTALSSPRLRLVEADVRDQVALRAVLAREKPQIIVHLAARAGVRPSLLDPELYLDVNVRGTLSLLAAARESGVPRVVFASSSSVYGIIEGMAREDGTPCHPLSPYGASKVAGEALCSAYAHTGGPSVVALRFFTVYGPRQRPDMAINRFTRLIAGGQEVGVHGDGHSLRDYTFISDIVDGIEAALEAELPGYHVFNLGRGQPAVLLDVIRLIEKGLEAKAKLRFLPQPPGEPPLTHADIGKAGALLGYRPSVSIEEGIARYVRWLQERGEVLSALAG
jgi:UDP-glucuronate 4-epimerase